MPNYKLRKILKRSDARNIKSEKNIGNSLLLNKTKRIRVNYVVNSDTIEDLKHILEYANKKLNINLTYTDIFQIAIKGIAKNPVLISKWIKG